MVSIHVPARGTTLNDVLSDVYSIVSIHVPARGTTLPYELFIILTFCFNPRSREGNDGKKMKLNRLIKVSIHVPARGTTKYELYADGSTLVSIHVPARGTTAAEAEKNRNWQVSIHVPARGTTEDKRKGR